MKGLKKEPLPGKEKELLFDFLEQGAALTALSQEVFNI
jgi:hypothetical protein